MFFQSVAPSEHSKNMYKVEPIRSNAYQEMYASDVMTMTELKAKTSVINEELKELDYSLEQYQRSLVMEQDGAKIIRQYTEEIESFLKLETVTNNDLLKIIDHMTVNKDGEVKIYIKKLGELVYC